MRLRGMLANKCKMVHNSHINANDQKINANNGSSDFGDFELFDDFQKIRRFSELVSLSVNHRAILPQIPATSSLIVGLEHLVLKI